VYFAAVTSLATTAQQVELFAAERRFRSATVERWLRLPEPDAGALLGLARQLRLGENQLADLWRLAEEIAAREQLTLAAVLESAGVLEARRREVGRNDRLRLVKDTLRRWRYPQLVAAEDRLRQLVRELDLPRNVEVGLPNFLEGDGLRLQIEINSPAALAAVAVALQRAAASPQCAEIFALLEEAP
jgi:hypothetical protein